MPKERLEALAKKKDELLWKIDGDRLVSDLFPSGVTGQVLVTKHTLVGKSDDLERSSGFFVYVRDRLINESDALFGLKPLVHGLFNRFRADVFADDLDKALKASRENIEESTLKNHFRVLLREVFNEAVFRYVEATKPPSPRGRREGDVATVPPYLVDLPIADALAMSGGQLEGAEADNSWFYLKLPEQADLAELVRKLYTETRTYKYNYVQRGSSERLVEFDPSTSTFWLNQDHELVQEYENVNRAQTLLEDFVTAEALLEIYLREANLSPHIVGNVLQRRDLLFRRLVRDHTYSPVRVAQWLRGATGNEHELEVALVVAARTLGFVANHLSGDSDPDGLARFSEYTAGETKITLEAKSSGSIPSLGALDFAGLREHIERNEAQGCLLVAPDYPGRNRDEDSAASKRAEQQRISCWTVEQLASVVEEVETRHFNASHVLDIVLNAFSPDQVALAVEKLLAEPQYSNAELYRAVLTALRTLEGRMPTTLRNVDMIATEVTNNPTFSRTQTKEIEAALVTLAEASLGGLIIRGRNVHRLVVLDELDRRLANLTIQSGTSRTRSAFRYEDEGQDEA